MKQHENAFRNVIKLAGQGATYPVADLVNKDPERAAMLSKLHQSQRPTQYDERGERRTEMPNIAVLRNRSGQISNSENNAELVFKLLPDMELGAQILISTILSPKDMMTTELTFVGPKTYLPPDIVSSMTARLSEYFEQDYKIKNLLPEILRDVLFNTGSYPIAIIPENSIDDVINSSGRITMESLSEHINTKGGIKTLGILGPSVLPAPREDSHRYGLSMESFTQVIQPTDDQQSRMILQSENGQAIETYTTVVDNPSVLKYPLVLEKIREQRVMDAIHGTGGSKARFAFESFGFNSSAAGTPAGPDTRKLNERELSQLLYKNRSPKYTPILALKTQDQLSRRTVGEPLWLHIPSAATLPVFQPGNPKKHLGYFILIDETGNPINPKARSDYYGDLGRRMSGGGNFATAMLQKVNSNYNGISFNSTDQQHLDYVVRVYADMVEKDLLQRLRNGIYGNGVAISSNRDEVYRIMLTRALAQQQTQVLYVPAEQMTYYAFRFNEEGIGESLLENLQIINSLRSQLMFANNMAALKNSIGRTAVNLKLDPRDPDPAKKIELMQGEFIRSRNAQFPIGVMNPSAQVDFLTRAGYEFTYEGHPGLPDVKIDITEKSSQHVKPDTELEENLRKQATMGIGLTPETLDATLQADFATSVVTNNIMLAKRALQYQELFEPLIADNCRKMGLNSEKLISDLKGILSDNFDRIVERLKRNSADESARFNEKASGFREYLIDLQVRDFMMGFEVTLPKPNSVSLENQATALDTYVKALDAAIAAYIDSSFLNSSTAGDVSEDVDTIKAAIKSYYIRRWMSENGFLPEIAELVTRDEDGKPCLDVYAENAAHIASVALSLNQFLKGVHDIKNDINKEVEQRNQTDTTESSNAPEPTSTLGEPASDGGGFSAPSDNGLDGDFQFDLEDDDLPKAPAGPTEETQTEESSSSTTTDAAGNVTQSSSSSSSSTSGQ